LQRVALFAKWGDRFLMGKHSRQIARLFCWYSINMTADILVENMTVEKNYFSAARIMLKVEDIMQPIHNLFGRLKHARHSEECNGIDINGKKS
jgi:hypothetical protein